ncbi:MAG TPA: tRNA uracil 4-sulfurtransferase ThiI [Candidatus Dormibacteraeota bacterium]|nr:tRNA uracil 4-sulfurtransferase ThiI [Candidatus Dormibacteraeota bacterium]
MNAVIHPREDSMGAPVIVVHYHELWLKGGNRRFFLGKLFTALRRALAGIPVERIEQPGDRFLIRLAPDASVLEALDRVQHVFGIAYCAVARPVDRDLETLCRAAWEEIEPLRLAAFAVRAKRSDKTFPHSTMQIEAAVGRFLLEKLRANGRDVRVQLRDPELTCHIEVTPGPLLVYARKISGLGGLPANTAGRLTCLLSGGYDSAVAAYHMMKRGAHLSFVHFYGTGARPGESSLHVASGLARVLTRYQFTAKLYRVPFEEIQREIVRYAPEACRVLLYRRMMLRITEPFARRDRALALVTGDSLGQVASQTLRNLVAVDAAATMPVFRPLVGTDKMEILDTARRIGTYDISSEPFHDCCPVFLPRSPELSARPEELSEAEAKLDLPALVAQGIRGATIEKFAYAHGRVEASEPHPVVRAGEPHPTSAETVES